MPRVVAFFDSYVAKAAEAVANAPKLVSIEPSNGASDVDPSLKQLVIRFDRAMRDKSWAVVGTPGEQPEFTGTPAYDAERKVLTIPMRLEPGRTYRFGLNGPKHQGFVSADGFALQPIEVSFTTRR
jgi:hypothetical protein